MPENTRDNSTDHGTGPAVLSPDQIKVKGQRLTGEVRQICNLEHFERDRLLELMQLNYDDVDRQRFTRDLLHKQWVLLLVCNDSKIIQGFSTAISYDTMLDGLPMRALYSGDTIIHNDFWGERTIGKLWLRFALDQYQRRQGRQLYWFLISMGHRTYRLLRIFFKVYWPRHDQGTPSFEKRFLDHLGRLEFGAVYDETRGVIVRKEKRESLRPTLAEVSPGRLKDPDIAYFLRSNPGYQRGDELACLAEIAPDNIRPKLWRVFELGTPDQYRGS